MISAADAVMITDMPMEIVLRSMESLPLQDKLQLRKQCVYFNQIILCHVTDGVVFTMAGLPNHSVSVQGAATLQRCIHADGMVTQGTALQLFGVPKHELRSYCGYIKKQLGAFKVAHLFAIDHVLARLTQRFTWRCMAKRPKCVGFRFVHDASGNFTWPHTHKHAKLAASPKGSRARPIMSHHVKDSVKRNLMRCACRTRPAHVPMCHRAAMLSPSPHYPIRLVRSPQLVSMSSSVGDARCAAPRPRTRHMAHACAALAHATAHDGHSSQSPAWNPCSSSSSSHSSSSSSSSSASSSSSGASSISSISPGS